MVESRESLWSSFLQQECRLFSDTILPKTQLSAARSLDFCKTEQPAAHHSLLGGSVGEVQYSKSCDKAAESTRSHGLTSPLCVKECLSLAIDQQDLVPCYV